MRPKGLEGQSELTPLNRQGQKLIVDSHWTLACNANGAGGKRLLRQPAQVMRDVIALPQQTWPKSIDILLRLADDLWTLEGDVTQVHQLLMHLGVNSRDMSSSSSSWWRVSS